MVDLRKVRTASGATAVQIAELSAAGTELVDEFLADLCDTAMWMDQGTIKEHAPLRDVLRHHKGRDVIAELSSR